MRLAFLSPVLVFFGRDKSCNDLKGDIGWIGKIRRNDIYIRKWVNRSCNKFLKREERTMEGLAGLSKR